MLGQGSLGALVVGEPEELVTAVPVPAVATVWFTVDPTATITIQVPATTEELE